MRMVFSRSRQRATLPRMTSQVPARKTVWDFPGRAFNYLNVPYLCSMAFHCRVRGSNRATVPLCSVSPLLLTGQASPSGESRFHTGLHRSRPWSWRMS